MRNGESQRGNENRGVGLTDAPSLLNAGEGAGRLTEHNRGEYAGQF